MRHSIVVSIKASPNNMYFDEKIFIDYVSKSIDVLSSSRMVNKAHYVTTPQ